MAKNIHISVLYGFLLSLAILVVGCRKNSDPVNEDLIPVRFNNPGLHSFLGVGLWAWPLPMDYDLDGDLDLVVSCPDKPFNGIYFFENKAGKGVKFPVFEAPVRLGPGEKHLQVCITDSGIRVLGPGTEYLNFRDSLLADPLTIYPRDSLEGGFIRTRFSQWKYVDYEGDGDLDLIAGIDEWGDYGWDNAYDTLGDWRNGPLHAYVFLVENVKGTYINRGKLYAGPVPVDVYGAPSPNMMDFDLDGDLDLLCGEFLDGFTWFENTGTREIPRFTEGRILKNENGPVRMDLQMCISTAIDWDEDGDADLIVGDEDGRVALLENTGKTVDHMPVFNSPVYFMQKADLVKFGALVTPFSVDWDSDGDEDLICGNTAGYIGFIENLDGGNPPEWANPRYLEVDGKPFRIMAGKHGSIQGPAEAKWGYTTLTVSDWDMDGLQDVVFNSIWGRVQWLKNTGSQKSPVLTGPFSIYAEFDGHTPKPAWNWWSPREDELVTQWRTTPYATDWDGDGLTDLVMLDTEGYLSFYQRYESQGELKLRAGKRIFYGLDASVFDNKNRLQDSISGPLRLNNKIAGSSGRVKFTFVDWDMDGDRDLVVNSTGVALFENIEEKDGRYYFRHRGDLTEEILAGHTTSPTVVDWDKNGYPDLLIGAEDGHLYLLKNKNLNR